MTHSAVAMKVAALILSSLLGSALGSPAIVWQGNSHSSPVQHNSHAIHARDLLADVFNTPSLALAAVFVVGRHADGTEGLSSLASSGALPGVASNYESAHSIYHNVGGVDSVQSVLRDVRNGLPQDNPHVLETSLGEFNRKLSTLTQEEPVDAEVSEDGTVDQVMAKANVVLVNVGAGTNAEELDSSIVRAIEHGSISSVVLTGIRGFEEVKQDRNMQARHRMAKMTNTEAAAGRRRLEDAADDDAANNNNNNNKNQNEDDLAGIYYVHMTPNIFAGILFLLFFTFISFLGLSCMGMISNSDVYVSKLPPVGREA